MAHHEYEGKYESHYEIMGYVHSFKENGELDGKWVKLGQADCYHDAKEELKYLQDHQCNRNPNCNINEFCIVEKKSEENVMEYFV